MAWTIAIALILIGGAGLLALIGKSMDSKEHPWLKVLFIFGALWTLTIATNVGINIVDSANITVNESITNPIINRFGAMYKLQFGVIYLTFVYFFVYFMVKMFSMLKQRKNEKEEQL